MSDIKRTKTLIYNVRIYRKRYFRNSLLEIARFIISYGVL